MDFTREPVIEAVITPKEGCKLVVRSSKTVGQEEYFVDSLEIVSFGKAVFFRSMERPKSFLVPITDYEVVEVRETRMVLKTTGTEKGAIKISGGRGVEKGEGAAVESKKRVEAGTRLEKKKRRQHSRRRKVREEREDVGKEEGRESSEEAETEFQDTDIGAEGSHEAISPSLTSLLPPPKTLIRETISRYKEDELFKDAFFGEDEEPPEEIIEAEEEEWTEELEEEEAVTVEEEEVLPSEEESSSSEEEASKESFEPFSEETFEIPQERSNNKSIS